MSQGSRRGRLLRRPTPAFASSDISEDGPATSAIVEDTDAEKQGVQASPGEANTGTALSSTIPPTQQNGENTNPHLTDSTISQDDRQSTNHNDLPSTQGVDITQSHHGADLATREATKETAQQKGDASRDDRDIAISRSSDEEVYQRIAADVPKQDKSDENQQHTDTAANHGDVVSEIQGMKEIQLDESDAEVLESMLATVPSDAVAQLMQALLVQPKVNRLNAAVWRSGGMQVTHGTHKSYKLLAGQYGVHMRDIVEQTLKACLPIWRARLKQLRADGVLGDEEAEEELEE